jgi:hypothetical protein
MLPVKKKVARNVPGQKKRPEALFSLDAAAGVA